MIFSGDYTVTIAHLQQLVDRHSKDKHALVASDLNPCDRMKFNPTKKIMKKEVIDYLEQHVQGSNGTVALLRVMSSIYMAFNEENLKPLERIYTIWLVFHTSCLLKLSFND